MLAPPKGWKWNFERGALSWTFEQHDRIIDSLSRTLKESSKVQSKASHSPVSVLPFAQTQCRFGLPCWSSLVRSWSFCIPHMPARTEYFPHCIPTLGSPGKPPVPLQHDTMRVYYDKSLSVVETEMRILIFEHNVSSKNSLYNIWHALYSSEIEMYHFNMNHWRQSNIIWLVFTKDRVALFIFLTFALCHQTPTSDKSTA